MFARGAGTVEVTSLLFGQFFAKGKPTEQAWLPGIESVVVLHHSITLLLFQLSLFLLIMSNIMSNPLPMVVCGRRAEIARGVIQLMKPEYEGRMNRTY